jgi:tetratricopeptide (TPR) repeat protein
MKLISSSFLLAAIAGLPTIAAPPTTAPATQPAKNGEQLFAQGRDAMFRRDYNHAIELLREAVATDNTKTNYRLHLARALQYAGEPKEAQAILTEIVKTNPDHVEAGQLLGEIYAKAEDWKSVISLLEPLLKYRHDYSTYHMLAEAKYNLGDAEHARKYYEEAIKINPTSASDHYAVGNIYLGGNFFSLAAESYEQALRLGLQSPVLHYKLGTAYFNLRNYFGNVTTATIKSGQAGTISGEYFLIEPVPGHKDLFRVAPSNSAIYQVAKAIADGIDDRPDIQFLRANIYMNAGRYEQAHAMYKAIGPKIPKEDLPLFYYYFAQSAFGSGDYEEYLKLLQEAIRLNPAAYQSTLVDAYLKVAEEYNQSGQMDKFIAYLSKAVNESPQSAALHLRLGNAFEEAGQFKEAAIQWQMTLDLEPDHPKKLELLNLIQRNRNKPPATQPTTKPAR